MVLEYLWCAVTRLTGERPTLLVLVSLALIGDLGCRGQAMPQVDAPRLSTTAMSSDTAGPVLLLTHPSAKVLANFRFLVENKVLDLPGLRVVGIYQHEALANWRDASRYLRRVPLKWIALRKIRCDLDPLTVFGPNACSASFRQLLRDSDGIVFTGGPDLPPSLYGKPMSLLTRVKQPQRHLFEASLIYHLIGTTGISTGHGVPPLLEQFPHYPVLAICLGMETLNVVAGGTLVQDIPSELYGAKTVEQALALPPDNQHACYDYRIRGSLPRQDWKSHPVRLTPGWSYTAMATENRTVDVISAHHQALGQLGKELIPLGYSLDRRVVEAVGHRRFTTILGVQFHPEYSKAFVPQRRCLAAAELDSPPRYRLNEPMVDFYRAFWRNFAAALRRSRQVHLKDRSVE